MKCQFCNENDLIVHIDNPKDYEYQKSCSAKVFYCKICSILTQFPLPSQEEIHTYYDKDTKLTQILKTFY